MRHGGYVAHLTHSSGFPGNPVSLLTYQAADG